MTVIQIVVPVTPDKLHLLEDCLRSIKGCTPVDHVVNVAVGRALIEDKVGEVIAVARSVYNRTGLVLSTADPDHGYNGMVMGAMAEADYPYFVVVPATHRIVDKGWFGKMQLPLLRAPQCGMTFAPDEIGANTTTSFPLSWKEQVTSKFFMLSRQVMDMARLTPIDADGEDIATAIRDHLRTVGTCCWAVPSCRVEQMHADWQ